MKKKKILILSAISSISLISSCYSSEAKECECEECPTKETESTQTKTSENERFVYKHVICVGVDGAGSLWNAVETPNFDRIFGNYAITNYCFSNNPTISAQTWGSMFYGVPSYIHGRSNSTSSVWSNTTYPSIFKQLEDSQRNSTKFVIANWNGIAPLVENSANVRKITRSSESTDQPVVNDTVEAIKFAKPTLLFTQFDIVDHVGHANGYNTTSYFNALKTADTQLGQIYDAVVDAGIEEDTLFMVIADHGGVEKNHGSVYGYVTNNEALVTCAMRGKSVVKSRDFHMQCRDFASIVGYALDFKTNDLMDSYLPKNVFKDNINPDRNEFEVNPNKGNGANRVLGNYVDTSRLKLGLLFDSGTIGDINGARTSNGNSSETKIVDGYKGLGFRNQASTAISCDDLSLGADSFTISMWLRPDAILTNNAENVIFSNKNWTSGNNSGINLYISTTEKLFNLSCNIAHGGSSPHRYDTYATPDTTYVRDKWIHWMVVRDSENNVLNHYLNFKKVTTSTIPSGNRGKNLDTSNTYKVGIDGANTEGFAYKGILDDFLVFDHAVTEDEVTSLRNFYSD